MVNIRGAIPDDLPQIVAIEHSCFSDPWPKIGFEPLFSDTQSFILVAVAGGGSVVGYSVARWVADEAEILNLAVEAEHRQSGIGGHLLDSVLAALDQKEIVRYYLEVRESNAGALALYRSRGFAEIARRKGYYRKPTEDAMVLELNRAHSTIPPIASDP